MNYQSATSALLTDLYQLTMAQGYFLEQKADCCNEQKTSNHTQQDLENCGQQKADCRDGQKIDGHTHQNLKNPKQQIACFHLHFRDYPFNGGYAIACGIAQIVEYVNCFHFDDKQIQYLQSLKSANGEKMFDNDFLQYLSDLKLSVDIDAVEEGTVVFPHEPVLRVIGPILDCQLIETPLLNAFNFQTLVATKSARICSAAGCPVMEFGLRRAQGPEGALWASRAACIGGCASTSNVEAGYKFGLPVSGTHSHSWVQSFASELDAFRAYARAFPHNCVLLVDTYDIEEGIKNAIKVGLEMKDRGEHLQGIRLDSGDLSWLSKNARKMLDEAGLEDTGIVLSNDLDEYSIRSIRAEGGSFTGLGVGTKLATAYDQPALGGVYKLSAIKNSAADCDDSEWIPKMKISETSIKTTVPGVLNVRRYYDNNGKLAGDMIYDIHAGVDDTETIVDPFDNLRRKPLGAICKGEPKFSVLLKPIVRGGRAVDTSENELSADELGDFYKYTRAKERAQAGLTQLDETQKRTLNPHTYPVGLEHSLNALRSGMVAQIRGIHN